MRLVVFDSTYGNTRQIAEAIANEIEGKAIPVKEIQKSDLSEIELLIVGSPINGWQPLPSISEFLKSLPDLSGVSATSFDTRVKLFIHGDAKNKIAKALKSAGAEIVTDPMAFYVKGSEGPLLENEIENAKKWAREIVEKIAN